MSKTDKRQPTSQAGLLHTDPRTSADQLLKAVLVRRRVYHAAYPTGMFGGVVSFVPQPLTS
jgi:hypothetical protein